MLTQEDLQAISQLIKNEVEPINKRLDKVDTRLDSIETRLDNIEEDIEVIKEDCEITRVSTNELVKWVDVNFHDERPFPVDDEFDEEIRSILKQKK